MNKPASLGQALRVAIPQLHDNPDKLHLFIENGSLACTAATSLSFEYAYTLSCIITDFTGHQDSLFIPLLIWLRQNQPELFQNRELMARSVKFQSELLSNGSTDVEVTLQLTERVIVRQDGPDHIAQHAAEPQLEEWGDWEVFLRGNMIYPSGDWSGTVDILTGSN